jgi:putative GTP pyrophosphokinase
MDEDALKREYASKTEVYAKLEEEARFILNAEIERGNIKTHSVTSRIKSPESFVEKARRKQCQKPFEEIRDIVGLRVICLFLSDVPRLGDLIRNVFSVIAEDNKVEDYDSRSFGYMSVHFVGTMKDEYKGPRYNQLAGVAFEIQVATLAMHAWASISHYLDYKSEVDVPKELKKDFYALSGLFYVADTHFEMFFKARQAAQQELAKRVQGKHIDRDEEINLDSLNAYLQSKYKDRERSDVRSLSELVSELSQVGFTKIDDLERLATVAWDAFQKSEEVNPPLDEAMNKTKYTDVGVVRSLLDLASPSFRKLRNRDDPPPERLDLLQGRFEKT